MSTLKNVAGWAAVIIFTASLVGLLLFGIEWLLAATVASAIAIVFLTQDEIETKDESYGQDPGDW